MANSPIAILDGGLSTALAELGRLSDGPLWTGELLLNEPEGVTAAHRGFVDAGAEILITGSYQLSHSGGRLAGWSEDDVDTALRNSTTAARLASEEGTLVAASVGPFGAVLPGGAEFTGIYDTEWRTVRDFHAKRLDTLLATDPDLLAVETMPDLTEIDIILALISERAPDLPLWVSCTIGEIGRTRTGQPFQEVASRVEEHAAAIAVGINCSAPSVVSPTLQAIDTDLPFIIYPNLGQTWDGQSQQWIGGAEAVSQRHLAEWVNHGARIIGGCCGYGTRDIRALAQGITNLDTDT